MNFEPVIGIEVHVELNTQNKMFSPAKVGFNDGPNNNVTEIDLGYPGALPSVNEEGVEFAIKLAHALNADIERNLRFDRKHYFYYDNSKGYQITQHERPIGTNGYIELLSGKKIKVTELHLEEDTAKTTNLENETLIDFNRAGIPLIEIVSGNNITSAKEAYEYLELLKNIVSELNISDAKMEEGSIRVDVNVSIRPKGYDKYNTKVEIKNLNSFANVMKAIDFEVERQSKDFINNIMQKQQTRRYDDKTRTTVLQRVKETKDDYFYIPEADIFPILLTDDFIEKSIDSSFLTPMKKYKQYVEQLKDEELAKFFTLNLEVAKYFNQAKVDCLDLTFLANNIKSELLGLANKENFNINSCNLTPIRMRDLVNNVANQTISSSQNKKLIKFILDENKDVDVLIEEKQMAQISDVNLLSEIVEQVLNLERNQSSIEDFKNGKDRAVKALMGQCMKETKGKANPKLLNEIVLTQLQKR